jgi:chitin synthase
VWARVLARLRKGIERESTVVRWSAINCGPTELPTQSYKLRPQLYARPRQTKLLVSITISDTDRAQLIRNTLDCILLNVKCIETETDLDPVVSWKDIVIVFVGSSGTMLPETSNFLRRLNLLTKSVWTPRLDGLVGHIYEVWTPI